MGLLLGGCALVGAVAALQASCAQTPTPVPVQSFGRPQDVDVVCMEVLDQYGQVLVPAIPEPEAQCAPVPVNITGSTLQYHLLALVTQTTQGAVAVVDLTAGNVVDEDPATPGINFLPVGTLPSGIASTPDGVMTFVASASPNLPAIYALPSSVILGNSEGTAPDGGTGLIPVLTTWPACLLPQAPGALAIVPTSLLAREDAGASAAAGDASTASGPGYVLVAVLPGDSAHPATVATFDPAPFLRGAAGLLNTDAGVDPNGPSVPPGSLVACPLIQRVELAAPAASTTWSPGPAWDDGIRYVDGGVDAEVPLTGVSCTAIDAGGGALFSGAVPTPLAGAAALDTSGAHPILYVADTQLPVIHAVDVYDPTAPVELAPYLATSIAEPSRVVSVGKLAVSPTTRDYKRFLYAIDEVQGDIMVYDVSDPVNGPHVPLTRPHPEVDPLQPPDRILFSAPVATLAFAVHDWPLTQIVAPGTNGGASGEVALLTAETGLLCNPNPNIDPTLAEQNNNGGFTPDQGPFPNDPGGFYRANAGNQQIALGPQRLRGVFAFVTLSNGEVVTIDVDDWDAPCRRPDPMAAPGETSGSNPPILSTSTEALVEGPLSSIAPPEPAPDSPGDYDPYHAPLSYQTYDNNSPVTQEWFFPVSAPHRIRSTNWLRIDQTYGNHAPYLLAAPELYSSGAPIATQGDQAVVNPSLVPTDTPYVDPSLQAIPIPANPAQRTSNTVTTTTDAGFSTDGGLDASIGAIGDASAAAITLIQSAPGASPNVRFAWEDPATQVDQDWVVTYEGQLPGFYDNSNNPLVVANVVVPPGTPPGQAYQTVWLQSSDAYFCRKGVEDFAIGQQRAIAVNAELTKDGLPILASYPQRVGDYVQLTDDIRSSTDGYWNLPNACWTDPSTNTSIAVADRNNICNSVFGSSLDPSDPSTARDFPILEAYDDHLVIGRFGYPDGDTDGGVASAPRQVVSADPTNVPYLTLMQCCFANQVHFNVRTGGEWSAVGSSVAFLSHVAASGSDNRCTTTCDEHDALLNGRSPPVPRPATQSTALAACPPPFIPSINRDSPLALRNPMFSFLVWDGQDPTSACADTEPIRDMAWKFSTRGQLEPQTLNLGATTTALSPQTMKFIDSLGQLAIIDGESQGLILMDLGSLAEAHTPYF